MNIISNNDNFHNIQFQIKDNFRKYNLKKSQFQIKNNFRKDNLKKTNLN